MTARRSRTVGDTVGIGSCVLPVKAWLELVADKQKARKEAGGTGERTTEDEDDIEDWYDLKGKHDDHDYGEVGRS